MADLHYECQELKPKVERNISFLVLHPSSGVDTVNTIGSHLRPLRVFMLTKNNKSESIYRGKFLGWPVTRYGGAVVVLLYIPTKKKMNKLQQEPINGCLYLH